jgi:hypothetical protein
MEMRGLYNDTASGSHYTAYWRIISAKGIESSVEGRGLGMTADCTLTLAWISRKKKQQQWKIAEQANQYVDRYLNLWYTENDGLFATRWHTSLTFTTTSTCSVRTEQEVQLSQINVMEAWTWMWIFTTKEALLLASRLQGSIRKQDSKFAVTLTCFVHFWRTGNRRQSSCLRTDRALATTSLSAANTQTSSAATFRPCN